MTQKFILILFITVLIASCQEAQPKPTAVPTPIEPTVEWRNVGTIDNPTAACIAPSAAEYYAERQMEFGGSGGTFSNGSLQVILENLPYGDCNENTKNFPYNAVTQCSDAFAFADSGGFTSSNEYFSTETGELVYAATSTDFNAFCKNASFDVAFGEKPETGCQTTRVSYCNISQEELLGLFDSGDFGQIVPTILAAQDE